MANINKLKNNKLKMEKEEEIKLVHWCVDDIFGELRRISLVDEPAIEQDFMLFSKEVQLFKTIDTEKREIVGPVMRPNIKIMRRDKEDNIYYGYFDETDVRKAAQLFFRSGNNTDNTNLQHKPELSVDGIYVFESWIVEDPELDKAKALGFKDINKGDWYVNMKVENDIVWSEYLKTGKIRGFSVEIKSIEKVEKEQIKLSEMKKIVKSDVLTDKEKVAKLIEISKN